MNEIDKPKSVTVNNPIQNPLSVREHIAATVKTTPTPSESVEVPADEFLTLCAVDSALFMHHFFPKTARQKSPPFHADVFQALEQERKRFVNLQMFRGSAKTTTLRGFTAKRVAYGLSRTILYISKSADHARRSLGWIKRQVEFNPVYRETFKLAKGETWRDDEVNIQHGVEEHSIWIKSMGITGAVRGVNFDDYRPDLIVIDDVIDEENALTREQRQKVMSLIRGALKEGLAPRSEAPHAKMVMLQTPLDFEDASEVLKKDPEWLSLRFGCWTRETENLPIEYQESAWPERWASEELRNEKRAAAAMNEMSTFMREKECKLTSPETSAFRPEWLMFYDDAGSEQEPPIPGNISCVLVIDPVPPPTESEIQKGLHNKDYEAIAIVGRRGPAYFVCEVEYNRGHDPNWTKAIAFSLAMKWKPMRFIVEAIAYQATLAWILRDEMKRTGRYWQVEEYGREDRRKKYHKIIGSLKGVASNRQLYVSRNLHEFISQFIHYPNVPHDDVIEAVSIGLASLVDPYLELSEGVDYKVLDAHVPNLVYSRGCP